jgi:hypothetical protein
VGVNRANLQTMLTGFSDAFDSLYEEMKHQQKLTERKLLNFFRVTTAWREKVFFFTERKLLNFFRVTTVWREKVFFVRILSAVLNCT